LFLIEQTERFKKWLQKLKDPIGKAALIRRLNRLKQGHAGDSKPIGDAIYELRVHAGPGYRVYYLHEDEQIILLLCGGDKGSQQRDIEQAKKLAQEKRDENH